MKKKMLFLLLIICIGLFIPRGVFAVSTSSKQFVDYRFFIKDNDGKSIKGLHFTLHDKDNLFNYSSQYNDDEGYYYFLFDSDADIKDAFPEQLSNIDYEFQYGHIYEDNSDFIINDFKNRVSNTNKYFLGKTSFAAWDNAFLTAYANEPLILEEKSINYKKIVFGSLHFSLSGKGSYSSFYYHFFLDNVENEYTRISCNKVEINEYYEVWNDSRCSDYINLNNTDAIFMRNAVFDYSDELWEELNNGPIASPEMSLQNSSVIMYNSGSSDLSTPSVIRLNKKEESKPNSIIPNIVNPKTWTNGVIILVISLMLVTGIIIIVLKERSVKI